MISFSAKELERRTDRKVSYEIDELVELEHDVDDIEALGHTKGKVEFKLRNNFIIITGNFSTPVRLTCDRCTKEFDTSLAFEIDEAIEVSDEPFPEEIEHTAESIHERIGLEEEIDIRDYIRQYIILNLPTKKLCSESCVNDKIDKFNDENKTVDPRWEKLLSYKDKIKGE